MHGEPPDYSFGIVVFGKLSCRDCCILETCIWDKEVDPKKYKKYVGWWMEGWVDVKLGLQTAVQKYFSPEF